MAFYGKEARLRKKQDFDPATQASNEVLFFFFYYYEYNRSD